MKIAVITPSIPIRSTMLHHAIRDVNQQTLPPDQHLIGVDFNHIGPARMRNQLISSTDADWVAFLDDDDRLDPHHLETLAAYVESADVIIPHCRFDGRPLPDGYYNRQYDRRALKRHGIFPITILASRDLMEKAGLFNPEDRYEDWSLWNRMADLGARFHVVSQVTWTYVTDHQTTRRTVNP